MRMNNQTSPRHAGRGKHFLWVLVSLAIITSTLVTACDVMFAPTLPPPTIPPPTQVPAAASVTVVPQPTTLPDVASAGKPVKLAWFYNPSIDADLKTLVNNFDVFILTKNYNGERETLRQLGVKTPIFKYLGFFEIQDLPCDAQPLQNNAAYKIGDFCDIRDHHQDWFMASNAGSRLCIEGWCDMDPGNQGWLSFWLSRAIDTQDKGWDGIFIDNVEASLSKRERENLMPFKYPDDASYQKMIEGALKSIYTSYFYPKKRPLYANIISVRDWTVWISYLQYLDGAMVEDFAVDWQDGYVPVQSWENQMDAIVKAQQLGKSVTLVAQGVKDDVKREEFALASYLLVDEGRASFRYTNARVYDEVWLYDNYHLNLGAAKGDRYREGSTWKRDFNNGTVTVDPAAHTASIIMK